MARLCLAQVSQPDIWCSGKVLAHSPCKGSSKVSRLLATLKGVLARATGVFHGFCAGLGVMLTKSEKSNGCPGVAGNRRLLAAPPGVVIMEDGSPRSLRGGGVDGGSILELFLTAGEGDAAR